VRVWVLAVSLLAAFCSSAPAAAKPTRIMSISLCTDALLLDLVPTDRITSITYLSRERSYSYLAQRAAHVRINYGLAEELLLEKPDLVISGTYNTPATRMMLKRLGMPLLEVPPANNFDEIRDTTRQVAAAVGEPERGEELLAAMDATLRELAQSKPRQVIRVVAWDGGGYVPGEGSLFDAILHVAGGVNIAAEPGNRGSSFGIERLLLAHPDVLAYGEHTLDQPALRTDADQHPLILSQYAKRRVTYPELLYTCGIPESAEAARPLRARLTEVMKLAETAR
jgi:iron complex transport system substrate-binding protein